METDVVKRGDTLAAIPAPASWVAVFNGWQSETDGSILTAETKIWENTIYDSEWIPVESIFENGLGISNVNVDGVDVDTLEKLIDEIKEKQNE